MPVTMDRYRHHLYKRACAVPVAVGTRFGRLAAHITGTANAD